MSRLTHIKNESVEFSDSNSNPYK